MPIHLTPSQLPARVAELRGNVGQSRVLIGIVGPPGAGKSTTAQWLTERLAASVTLPMDGFHLAQVQLTHLARAGRKGAPDTFDAAGFAALLTRVRTGGTDTIFAPAFNRELEEPIAGAIAVEPEHRVILVEGNYLLHNGDGWDLVQGLLDEVWFLDVAEDLRVDRLIRRHIDFGRAPEAARSWVEGVDMPNAELINSGRHRADVLVQMQTLLAPEN